MERTYSLTFIWLRLFALIDFVTSIPLLASYNGVSELHTLKLDPFYSLHNLAPRDSPRLSAARKIIDYSKSLINFKESTPKAQHQTPPQSTPNQPQVGFFVGGLSSGYSGNEEEQSPALEVSPPGGLIVENPGQPSSVPPNEDNDPVQPQPISLSEGNPEDQASESDQVQSDDLLAPVIRMGPESDSPDSVQDHRGVPIPPSGENIEKETPERENNPASTGASAPEGGKKKKLSPEETKLYNELSQTFESLKTQVSAAEDTWKQLKQTAEKLEKQLISLGILPTRSDIGSKDESTTRLHEQGTRLDSELPIKPYDDAVYSDDDLRLRNQILEDIQGLSERTIYLDEQAFKLERMIHQNPRGANDERLDEIKKIALKYDAAVNAMKHLEQTLEEKGLADPRIVVEAEFQKSMEEIAGWIADNENEVANMKKNLEADMKKPGGWIEWKFLFDENVPSQSSGKDPTCE